MRNKIYIYRKEITQNKLVSDSFWALSGNVIGKGLAFAAGVFIARFLGSNLYGEYGMLKTTLLNISILSSFGLGYAATKFVAQYKDNKSDDIYYIVKNITNITLVTSGLMAVLVFIFSNEIAVFLDAAHLSMSLKIFALNIIFNAILAAQIGIMAGYQEFRTLAKINAIIGIITLISSIIFTYLWNIEGALVALLISTATNCLLNYSPVKRIKGDKPHSLCFDIKKNRIEILKFSFPIALQEGIYAISSWVLILILIRLSTYAYVGVYNVAMQWASLILFIPGILKNVTLSHLSSSTDNLIANKKVFRAMLLVNLISTTIPFLVVCLFPNIVMSLYGKTYTNLYTVLVIVLLATIVNSLQSVYIQKFISQNRNWTMFYIRCIRDIGTIILCLIMFYVNDAYVENAVYYLVIAYLIMSVFSLVASIIPFKYKS